MEKPLKTMLNRQLENNQVAILATHGFEESELRSPMKALVHEGATVHVVSLQEEPIRGWHKGNWAMEKVHVDHTVHAANPAEYAGLVLPGGVMNPDALRADAKALEFVRGFFELGKPVAAICHAAWTLISAEVVEGRKMTSYHSIRKDLENAGVNWVDEAVVVDQGLVSSRNPGDLEAFNEKIVEEIAEGIHKAQRQSL